MLTLTKTVRLILAWIVLLPMLGYASERIVVGQVIDLSGPNAAIGRDYVAGIKTYFDSINAKGGVAGRRVEYVVRDDQGSPELTAKLVTELIDTSRIEILLGGIGNANVNATLNAPAFKRSSLSLFAPLVPLAPLENQRVIQWRPSYQQEIRFLFSHFKKLGITDVGLAVQGDASNEASLRNLTAEIQADGLRVSGVARLGANGEHSASEAQRLAALKPGFVLVVADSISSGLFLKAFRTHLEQTFVAGTSLTNLETLREIAGQKAVEWTVFSQVVPNPHSSSSIIQTEHNMMMKKYRDEAASSLTLEGFAVAKTLVKAIERSKNYRTALQEFRSIKGADIDLGGISMVNTGKYNYLSTYLDIALFRKGAKLVF